MNKQLRPVYHFMPKENWMNDPNGAIYYQNEFHLFYQHNPNEAKWGDIHWGHAKSKDLIHWEHLPIALYPSVEDHEEHCYSGCAVIDGDTVKIFYTSVGSGARNASLGAEQWMAVSSDGMRTWEKSKDNPILTLTAHNPYDIREWRDPFVWKDEDMWYMVVGGSHEGKGCAIIYRSAVLSSGWTFWNILFSGDEAVWECPNFFKLGNKWVLIVSPSDKVKYWTGELNADGTFTPEKEGIIDYGGWEGYYAPLTFLSPEGRRMMWGWLPENARGKFDEITEWAGVQSLPRELTLGDDCTLRFVPAAEMMSLRTQLIPATEQIFNNGVWATGVRGRALEVIVTFRPTESCGSFGLKVLHSLQGEEETILVINPETGHFELDRTQSSVSEFTHRTVLKGNAGLSITEDVTLRLYIDHSLVEVFVNDIQCLTGRVYPLRIDSDHVSVFAEQPDKVQIIDFRAWEMKSVS
jgi:beta-fructofuranosidase